MTSDPFVILPVEHRDAARAVLVAAFGAADIGMIAPVTGGASGALAFRIEIGNRRYLLRMEGPASPLRNPHQYLSMRIAAEAGIAPVIHGIDEAARIVVMDFISTSGRWKPIRAALRGWHGPWERCLRACRKLRPFHDLSNIPRSSRGCGPMCAGQDFLRPECSISIPTVSL
jgi:hypothetical protein